MEVAVYQKAVTVGQVFGMKDRWGLLWIEQEIKWDWTVGKE